MAIIDSSFGVCSIGKAKEKITSFEYYDGALRYYRRKPDSMLLNERQGRPAERHQGMPAGCNEAICGILSEDACSRQSRHPRVVIPNISHLPNTDYRGTMHAPEVM